MFIIEFLTSILAKRVRDSSGYPFLADGICGWKKIVTDSPSRAVPFESLRMTRDGEGHALIVGSLGKLL